MNFLAWILLGILCWCTYENGLDNSFAFDDHLAITNNADTDPSSVNTSNHSIQHALLHMDYSFLQHDIWGKDIRAIDSHRSYRPLLIFVFRIIRLIHGLNAKAMRYYSIFSHYIVCILVYHLSYLVLSSNIISKIGQNTLRDDNDEIRSSPAAKSAIYETDSFKIPDRSEYSQGSDEFLGQGEQKVCHNVHEVKDEHQSEEEADAQNGDKDIVVDIEASRRDWNLIAIGSGALFATHPVHVEAVTAVVNIAESLACIFYIIAYFLYLLNTKNESKSFISTAILSVAWLLVVYVAILLKETSLTVSGVILCDAAAQLFRSISLSYRSRSVSTQNQSLFSCFWRWLESYILWIVLCPFVLILYTILRYCLIHGSVISLVGRLLQGNVEVLTLQSSYLDESLLIRRAESPFSFLAGWEKIYSIQVSSMTFSFYLWIIILNLCLQYLHFRYLFVLLWPSQLSPEYAFDCIPKVSHPTDYRFLCSLCAYGITGSLVVVGLIISLRSRPVHRCGLTLSPFSLLRMMIWLIVPFIPASAVFLRLGTLLAERLLYIPSIGFCMLSSLLCYLVVAYSYDFIGDISRLAIRSGEYHIKTTSHNRRQAIIQVIYSALIGLTSIGFMARARRYNLSWKDDATLFLSSLDVCPRSAKLNLQIAKLHLNEMNITGAEYHIETAKSIDPTFCDVGYQEALLHVVRYEVDQAIHSALRNLECIYSSKQSLELVTKLWVQQLSMSGNNYRVYAKQAAEAYQLGHLHIAATNKYLTASDLAYKIQQYDDSLDLIHAAENMTMIVRREMFGGSIPSIFMTDEAKSYGQYEIDLYKYSNKMTNEEIDQLLAMDSLICNIHMKGGRLRYDLRKHADLLNERSRELLVDTDRMIDQAGTIRCIIIDPRPPHRLHSTSALDALNIRTNDLIAHFDRNNITSVNYLANFTKRLAKVLFLIEATRLSHRDHASNSLIAGKPLHSQPEDGIILIDTNVFSQSIPADKE